MADLYIVLWLLIWIASTVICIPIDANGNVIQEAIGGDSTRNWQILAKTNDFVGDWSLSGR